MVMLEGAPEGLPCEEPVILKFVPEARSTTQNPSIVRLHLFQISL